MTNLEQKIVIINCFYRFYQHQLKIGICVLFSFEIGTVHIKFIKKDK